MSYVVVKFQTSSYNTFWDMTFYLVWIFVKSHIDEENFFLECTVEPHLAEHPWDQALLFAQLGFVRSPGFLVLGCFSETSGHQTPWEAMTEGVLRKHTFNTMMYWLILWLFLNLCSINNSANNTGELYVQFLKLNEHIVSGEILNRSKQVMGQPSFAN